MEWSVFELENKFVKVEHDVLDKIPVLRFVPRHYEGVLPTVVYYHGWQSSKEHLRFQAMTIASFGYQVILPDALYHGQRGSIDYASSNVIERHFWEVIFKSIEEAPNFLSAIINTYKTDYRNIFLLGDSMGAITIPGIFKRTPLVKGMAAINGVFNWTKAIQSGILPQDDRYKDKIETYDLSNQMALMGQRPVLILAGMEDKQIPIQGQKEFYNAALKNGFSIEMIEFSCVGHRVTTSMLHNLITWLDCKSSIK